MSDKDKDLQERLKSGIWYTVGQIVDEECMNLDTNATPQFIAALTELVYAQATTLAQDLECFANHAKRSLISTEDVKLCARKNEKLEEVITNFIEKHKA